MGQVQQLLSCLFPSVLFTNYKGPLHYIMGMLMKLAFSKSGDL